MRKNSFFCTLLLTIIFSISPFAFAQTTNSSYKIAFLKQNDIWLIDENGETAPVNLTNNSSCVSWPSFSPDGTKIAFHSSESGRYELWIMDSDGSNKKQITGTAPSNTTPWPAYINLPIWSPDGNWIYFDSNPPGYGWVYKIRCNGTDLTQLTSQDNTMDFDISPDGSKMAFNRGVPGNGYTNQLYVSNTDFSNPILIQPISPTHCVRFSRDGSNLTYVRIIGSQAGIHLIKPDGTEDRLIYSGNYGPYPCDWHPSGLKILAWDYSNGMLYWIKTDGGARTLITQGEGGTIGLSALPPPSADAGPNRRISGENQHNTPSICGSASDPYGRALEYRWVEGNTELLTWQPVRFNGEACLDISKLLPFSTGQHTLRLEVRSGKTTSSDDMLLIVDNSPPHAAATGGGTYEIGSPVFLGGQISDFDGDRLSYEWTHNGVTIYSGIRDTISGGAPVDLPALERYPTMGGHIFILRVNDGVNSSWTESAINVNVLDRTAPTIAPSSSQTILWPPNHKMVNIQIRANARDNSGGPVLLNASVSSNEPDEGLDDGDQKPDWTGPVIDQDNGIISLQLRSERSGAGGGRKYTITVTATDSSNNSSSVNVVILVPHDQSIK